jgi:nucleoside phosphorylase
MALKQGDVIASNAAVISDWRMENGDEVTVGPYGWFDYRAPGPEQVRKMTIECQDDLVTGFMGKLPGGEGGFLRGNLLTSEAFVSGKDHKLRLGSLFGCLACDMESGVYGYVGNRLANVPWFNLRVVADTLDDTLSDYFVKERDMTEILGRKVVEALKVFDSSLA